MFILDLTNYTWPERDSFVDQLNSHLPEIDPRMLITNFPLKNVKKKKLKKILYENFINGYKIFSVFP